MTEESLTECSEVPSRCDGLICGAAVLIVIAGLVCGVWAFVSMVLA